jgi:hypothetical protein
MITTAAGPADRPDLLTITTGARCARHAPEDKPATAAGLPADRRRRPGFLVIVPQGLQVERQRAGDDHHGGRTC